MLPETNLFIPGERRLGAYTVTVARYINQHWSPTLPALRFLVTNQRLLVTPQVRRQYAPASIPKSYITAMDEVTLGERDGVRIQLQTGHQIHLLMNREHGLRLLDDLRAMNALPTRVHFDNRVTEMEIQRLISFLNHF